MDIHKRVAIIGGGAMGTGLAYHLADEGWNDVILLEKGELTSGSTWHAAGLCTSFIGGYAIGQLHAYGVQFYPRLEALTGQYVSWHECGSIRLAPNQDFLDWYRYVESLGPSIGFEVEILSPNSLREHHPYLETDGLLAGALTRGDGHVDPAGVANAMAAGARAKGVEIRRRCRVTGIERTREGSWRLATEDGVVTAEHVVNAAGCYARAVQAMVGGTAPLANMLHHYVVTEPIPELVEREAELPVVRDPHASCYLRQEQKAGLVGIYEMEGAAEAWAGGDPHWEDSNELFDPAYDRIAPWLERAFTRLPLFSTKGIKRAVHGAITHTPDSNPLIGPAPGLDNFWMCCGSSIGIAQGAGAGKYLAQWMVHGAADINMAALDPRRYGAWTTTDYTRAKSVQDYGLMYACPLPGEELPAGRPARRSALYERLRARGCEHTEAGGWERPKWFPPEGVQEKHSFRRSNAHDVVGAECRAVRERVGVMDFSSFSKFDISGPGAGALLGRLYANRPPATGRLVLSHRLGRGGRFEGESTIAGLAGGIFYVVTGAAWELREMDALRLAQLPGEEVEIRKRSDEIGVLVVAGPQARKVLAPLAGEDLGDAAFPWLSVREITLAEVPVRALRVNYVGALGWELHCPMERLVTLYDAILESGESNGIADFGAYAVDSLRLEKGYRGMGVELTNEIGPAEADTGRFVRGTGYTGEAAVQAAAGQPPATRIAYLELEDPEDADVIGGEAVFAGDRAVGVTTSGGYGHSSGKSLFFAYVPPELAKPGQRLGVLVLGERRQARVLEAPVHDPENRELRG